MPEDDDFDELSRTFFPDTSVHAPSPVRLDHNAGTPEEQFDEIQARHQPRQTFPAALDIVDDAMHREIERVLRHLHVVLTEPVTSHVAEGILRQAAVDVGHPVTTPPAGNPGWDFILHGQRISHKAQTGKTTRRNAVALSQLAVLYDGASWGHEEARRDAVARRVVQGLRDDFDRLVILRAFSCHREVMYQLVEIPKELLLRAEHAIPDGLVWAGDERKADRTFNLVARATAGDVLFTLQFEGDRKKVSLRGLGVDSCVSHGTWTIPLGGHA
jgi:type II restriction enzyme